MDVLTQFIAQYAGDDATLVLAIIGVCALICTRLPAPNKDTKWGKIYAVPYVFLNWFGQNWGKAQNHDDVEKRK